MKLLSQTIITCGLLLSLKLCAEYGCMDTSYHLAQLNDPKDYYYVTGADGGPCSCPCSKYCAQYRCSLARGQCPVCQHYRVPRPLIITRRTKASEEFNPTRPTNRYKVPIMLKKKATTQQAQS